MASARPTQSTRPELPPPQRQLRIAFESPVLHGVTEAERVTILMHLTNLLLEAAGLGTEGSDDDDL